MEYQLTATAKHVQPSAVREILKLTQGKSVISFAGGLPAEELFPVSALQNAFEKVFRQGPQALQYSITEGYTPLREKICERMKTKGIVAKPEDMLLTTGSQQAIDLLTRVYMEPGDVLLVEDPTYLAALQVFRYQNVQVVAVESDAEGMVPQDLLAKLDQYPVKMVYVTPTFSNPEGKVWSVERRQQLLDACRSRNILILEDDPYGDIQFHPEKKYPSIYSLEDPSNRGTVVYTSTFSKTVVPALRTGWVVGAPEVIKAMTYAKQAADLHSSSLDQQALYQLLLDFDLNLHIEQIRKHYFKRMRLMTQLLAEQQWDDIRWNQPEGGMFLWVEFPANWNTEELLRLAVQEGVAFVPGTEFFVNSPKKNKLRMNYTHSNEEQLSTGVNRLARAVEKFRA
ncbi:aminotransferase-like domain-containing protein [Effusibacillus dendaii]|uniref:Aminotransferase n=1 Tax=Effusibacillus dendaii TaxID=2743772 RepID=A0A7I8D7R8_9BACL|nr:PLP-dependent aminotransferase family protein [Effusibacillus dendaii]BCJ86188.1 aminotransferase [Effusibacillus dendaii]